MSTYRVGLEQRTLQYTITILPLHYTTGMVYVYIALYCVCFLSSFLFSALVANKGLNMCLFIVSVPLYALLLCFIWTVLSELNDLI